MDALLNSVLGQIEGSLGTQPAGVPDNFRKIKVDGTTFRISRFAARQCCNVAVMEAGTLTMKRFAVFITPLDVQAPLVCLDVRRQRRNSRYHCGVFEFEGPCYAPRYETIVADYLDTIPASEGIFNSDALTFGKHFNGLPGRRGRKQCECFVREFINRTCGIYSDADTIGAPGNEERDFQIEQIKAFATMANGVLPAGLCSEVLFRAVE